MRIFAKYLLFIGHYSSEITIREREIAGGKGREGKCMRLKTSLRDPSLFIYFSNLFLNVFMFHMFDQYELDHTLSISEFTLQSFGLDES